MKRIFRLILLLFVLNIGSFIKPTVSSSDITFGSQNSAIKIANGATLNIQDNGLTLYNGTLVREDEVGSQITGQTINFSQSILDSNEAESYLTASYDPSGSYDIIRLATNQKLRAEPGEIFAQVVVSGNNSLIEGQPTFRQNIQLTDATTTLTLAIQSRLTKNIGLAGGTLQLGDDLKLDDDVKFTGGGVVQLHGKQLVFGGKDLTWDNDVTWIGARDMVINSRIDLTSTWTFYGENHIAGNGNVLAFGTNGQLWVKKDSTLHLRDIELRNLGSGSIVFEDRTSHIRFSDTQVIMDNNYNVTCGGIYVDGESTIDVRNHILTFDTKGSLTVDGICLWYDLLRQDHHVLDDDAIKPTEVNDPYHKYIAYVNDGIIRKVYDHHHGPHPWEGVNYLNEDLWISPDEIIVVIGNKVVFGASHSIHFSRTSDAIYKPLIEIYGGKALSLLNIVLENFTPQHVEFDSASSVITFSHQTTIELPSDVDLNYTWSFVGDCILNGKGHTLKLGTGGRIMLLKADASRGMGHSALLFDDITIEGIGGSGAAGDNVVICDNTGTFSLNKAIWQLDNNYTFTKGKLAIIDEFKIKGIGKVFTYKTSQTSTIAANAAMAWDNNLTFSYDPPSASRGLISMTDATSIIFMNGASLYTTHTGIRLTKGTLAIDNRNYMYNVGANSISQAIEFGDGYDISNDLNIAVYPGGNFELMTGELNYNNVVTAPV